ncbi:MAG: ATP-binding protein [Anaerolineae bacterium]|nr:ATP-binding protein [Anaerolineae bacterium]
MSETTRGKELAALTAIAAQVNCTQDLDEILQGALETTLQVIGEQSGEIFLLDEETGELVLHTYQGVSDTYVQEESHIGSHECLCGRAVQTRQMLVVGDLASHGARTRTACLREGFRSCVRLPLMARGEVLGLLNIQSRNPRDFALEDTELLTAIGNQIGIAIANAQLIDDAERRRATLDSVMNSLVDGLILMDHHGRISYANPWAETILDLPAFTLIGRTLEDLGRAIAGRVEEPERMLRELQSAASNVEDTPAVEFMLNEPQSRTLQVRSFPIHNTEGGSQGVGLLLHDITRERELDEIKSRLLSTVSHELRTPLASIKGFATTLLREDVEWDETTRREFLSIIDEESDRLSELIGNLLDMSRIEAGELPVEPEPMDLVPMIQETAAEFQMMTRDHQFQLRLPPRASLVMADPRRTRQVLRNLVENAVKYSPGGGSICITAVPGEEMLVVSVADEGIGIESGQLAHVFDRFYQVDSASTRKVGGSGLGLSISKAIVEAQEGAIWADSEPGVGSTFHFSLPLVQASPTSHRPARSG